MLDQQQLPDVPDPQSAHAEKWNKRIKAAGEKQKDLRARWKTARRYVEGRVHDDGEAGLVRVNLIQAILATIQPQVYAKNPEISVTPQEQVDSANYPAMEAFSRTAEIMLNRLFVADGRLKERGKAAVRAALTTTIGWMKLSYQQDIRRDPQIEHRINDTQDDIRRLEALSLELREGNSGDTERNVMLDQMQQELAALEGQVEVISAEGFALDPILAEDVLILDDSIRSIDDIGQAKAIAHRIWMTKEGYQEVFQAPPEADARVFNETGKEQGAEIDDSQKRIAVWEIWDKRTQTVYTLAEGSKRWAKEPYQPDVTGERWYPFFALMFQRADKVMIAPSTVEMLIELQDEYSSIRTNLAEHRRENKPVRVYRKSGGISDPDIALLNNRRSHDWVGVGGDPNTQINNELAILNNPPIDPAVYDTSQVLRDIEQVSGATDASRGSINRAKTATEAEIMAMGLQSRTGEMLDVIEDWLTDMAEYALQIMLLILTRDHAVECAGDGAMWPDESSRDEAYRLISVKIRAGSTARPNKMRERDQWIQFMPQVLQLIQSVAQARQQQMPDLEHAYREVLEETLRRFDERLSVDSFLPAQSEEQPPQADPRIAQMEQVIQQLAQQMQEMQQAMQQYAAQGDSNLQREQIRADGAMEREQLKSETALTLKGMEGAQLNQNANVAPTNYIG